VRRGDKNIEQYLRESGKKRKAYLLPKNSTPDDGGNDTPVMLDPGKQPPIKLCAPGCKHKTRSLLLNYLCLEWLLVLEKSSGSGKRFAGSMPPA
jgi:hypothetical protein